MLSLSPSKLLVVLVIALIVLGPEKLPQVARQLGAFWGDVRKWRERLESEVRSTFPDLPATHEVVQAVRSPLSFLDRLADAHEDANSNGRERSGVTAPDQVVQGSTATGHDPPLPGNGHGPGNGDGPGEAASHHAGVHGPPVPPAQDRPDPVPRVAPRAATWRPPAPPADDTGWGHDDPSMN